MVSAEEFLAYYLGWAAPARRAYAAGAAVRLPAAAATSGRVVVCGMGGSGAAGDYVETLSRTYGGSAVTVVKGPRVPAWAGPGDLVVAVSFSGNTRETLECAAQALSMGAGLVAVTTGGRLAELARRWGSQLIVVGEAPAPRAGWPQLFYSIAGMLQANGLLSLPVWDVEESLGLLEAERGRIEEEARRLAEWLVEASRVQIVAAEPLYPAAVRLRSELAENSKLASAASMLPEAGHNELEAWAALGGSIDMLVLDPGVEPWSSLLREAVGLVGPRRLYRVEAFGETLLQKLVWLTWLAGVASVKAAVMRGVDPYGLSAVKGFRRVVEAATPWGSGEPRAPSA